MTDLLNHAQNPIAHVWCICWLKCDRQLLLRGLQTHRHPSATEAEAIAVWFTYLEDIQVYRSWYVITVTTTGTTGMADSPDHLLEQLQAHFDQPDRPAQDDDETSSAFDSELTENENPNEPDHHALHRSDLNQIHQHLAIQKSDEFLDSVAKVVVTSYMDDVWFSMGSATLNHLGEDWDRNVSTVTNAIAGIAKESQFFKIGITEDPKASLVCV